MGNMFADFGKGLFGQQNIPDLARFSGEKELSNISGMAPGLAGANLNYQTALAVPYAKLNKDMEAVYDPNQSKLRSDTSKSIMDDLSLGGELPSDVKNQVIQDSLEKAGAGGFGATNAGAGLVAKDLGLTSLDLKNSRMDRASRSVAQAPHDFFHPQSFVTPGDLLSTDIRGTENANQSDVYTAGLQSQNNQAMIESMAKLAQYAAMIAAM